LVSEIADNDKEIRDFFYIDGEWLLEDTWNNSNNIKKLQSKKEIKEEEIRTNIIAKLEALYKVLGNVSEKDIDNKKIMRPSEFYAIIMLDGDDMGKKISSMNNEESHKLFSRLLTSLSFSFYNIVKEHYGALIYSGGDDVLALLPVSRALECAYEIQDTFSVELKEKLKGINNLKGKGFSMSGAVVFAHHRLPLSLVLEEVRNGEKIAKNEGKDRLFIKYIKPSLSSAQITIEWGDWESFRNLMGVFADIPNTFAYQMERFLQKLGRVKNGDFEPIYKKIVEYLLDRKLRERKIEIMSLLRKNKIFRLKGYVDLPKFIKIIDFIKRERRIIEKEEK